MDTINYSDHYYSIDFLEALIKINENQFSYAYAPSYSNNDIIRIVIFDLYGTNEESLFIRYYGINLQLYNVKTVLGFSIFKFNSFIGMGLVGELNTDEYRCIYSIFGYSSKNKITYIDLEIYKNNQGFILDLNNFFSNIDNNLFGYELDIKISSIPNEVNNLRFFSINENKELKINDLIKINDKIIVDLFAANFQIGQNYLIELTSIISTPEYDKFILYYDKKEEFGGDNYQEYYERKIIEEKIFKVNLHISCHDQSIKTCNYPELTTKIIPNNSINIIYLSNYIYKGETNNLLNVYSKINNFNDDEYCNNNIIDNYQYNYMNDCINECPSCYASDLSKNCIYVCENVQQYLFNSKYYDNCPEGTIEDIKNEQKICKCKNLFYNDENLNNICLSSKICDDNHPILNDKTNECLNYNVKYENNYYLNCPKNTCISQKFWDLKICEEKTSDMRIFNGICFDEYSKLIDNIEYLAKNHIKIDNIEGIVISVYSYNNDYKNNFEELIQNNNVTIIDLRDYIEDYKIINKIDDNTDIYIVIIDTPRIYSNETTNRFYFELYFENKTKINIIDNNIKVTVYSPITNGNLLNIELINYFSDQGYNILNKNDKFYKDICSSANIDNNDITLNDRFIDIYPHDIQTCPKDCECIGVNLTTKLFTCHCQIKEDNEYEYELITKDEIINYFKDYNNLIEYFSDMFNFKIIKCFNLLLDINNYRNNFGLYIGISFFILSMGLLILFRILGYKKIRYHFYNNYISLKKSNYLVIPKDFQFNNKKEKDNIQMTDKFEVQNNDQTNKEKKKNENEDFFESDTKISINKTLTRRSTKTIRTLRKDYSKTILINKQINKNNNNEDYKRYNKNKNKTFIFKKEKTIKKNIKNLSFFNSKIEKDNQNFFRLFLSIIKGKIKLIQITFFPEKYSNRYLLFNLYLLDIYIDLLVNCILYNDYAVSQKYHNNGSLKFITSLIISLISNFFTSVILYYVNILTNYSDFMEIIIKEVKNTIKYFNIILKLFRVIACKIVFVLVFEILIGLFTIYYLFIFSTINSKSISSFSINFILSLIDSLKINLYNIC